MITKGSKEFATKGFTHQSLKINNKKLHFFGCHLPFDTIQKSKEMFQKIDSLFAPKQNNKTNCCLNYLNTLTTPGAAGGAGAGASSVNKLTSFDKLNETLIKFDSLGDSIWSANIKLYEPEILFNHFRLSYKYDPNINPPKLKLEKEEKEKIKPRLPAYADRILSTNKNIIENSTYRTLHNCHGNDHIPVYLKVSFNTDMLDEKNAFIFGDLNSRCCIAFPSETKNGKYYSKNIKGGSASNNTQTTGLFRKNAKQEIDPNNNRNNMKIGKILTSINQIYSNPDNNDDGLIDRVIQNLNARYETLTIDTENFVSRNRISEGNFILIEPLILNAENNKKNKTKKNKRFKKGLKTLKNRFKKGL